MSKIDSKQNEPSTLKIPPEISGLIHVYHDRFLADESLTDLDVILLSLYLIEWKNKKAGVKYDEAKNLFVLLGRKEKNYRVNIHLAKKKNLIEAKNTILNFTIKGLKRIRTLLGHVEKTPVYVIKSGQSFSAIMLFEKFLSTEIDAEELLLCDPHVSALTLFPFARLAGKVKTIKILTSNVYDNSKFEAYREKMQKETGIGIDVRVSRKIHDRYLISNDRCWTLGSSIKDLGNKDTTIREISEVANSMKELFIERWNETK
ncbi:MAG: hypothetical protein QXP38_13335 [Nitrososphaerota archaeon]